MTNLIDYNFTVIATKANGAETKTYLRGSYDSDAQAEMMGRDAAADIYGAKLVRINRHDVEWSINA